MFKSIVILTKLQYVHLVRVTRLSCLDFFEPMNHEHLSDLYVFPCQTHVVFDPDPIRTHIITLNCVIFSNN